mmetsp:Transcript_136693/g.354403  ORF Transcript_136693/g.354403 Transcript_136693/m.354403 type:complete len:444 (-) Transcript_136693:99-1430(-)
MYWLALASSHTIWFCCSSQVHTASGASASSKPAELWRRRQEVISSFLRRRRTDRPWQLPASADAPPASAPRSVTSSSPGLTRPWRSNSRPSSPWAVAPPSWRPTVAALAKEPDCCSSRWSRVALCDTAHSASSAAASQLAGAAVTPQDQQAAAAAAAAVAAGVAAGAGETNAAPVMLEGLATAPPGCDPNVPAASWSLVAGLAEAEGPRRASLGGLASVGGLATSSSSAMFTSNVTEQGIATERTVAQPPPALALEAQIGCPTPREGVAIGPPPATVAAAVAAATAAAAAANAAASAAASGPRGRALAAAAAAAAAASQPRTSLSSSGGGSESEASRSSPAECHSPRSPQAQARQPRPIPFAARAAGHVARLPGVRRLREPAIFATSVPSSSKAASASASLRPLAAERARQKRRLSAEDRAASFESAVLLRLEEIQHLACAVC